jgi:hypothetical protein
MKTPFSILALFTGLILSSCKTNGPTSPGTNTNGTPTLIGTPIGSPSSATIDATGGSLMSPDGRLELIIPSGALAMATQISIQSGTNEAPLGSGVAYSLSPNGLKFSTPITLVFHYTESDRIGTDVEALTVATQKDDRIWYAFHTKTLDTAAKKLSVQTTHFSWYTVLDWFRIFPLSSDVNINSNQDVRVMFLPLTAKNGNDPYDPDSPLNPANIYTNGDQVSWSINGLSPADSRDGRISPAAGSSTATYTAPQSVKNMNGNPAAVTALVNLPGNNQFFSAPKKLYLTSNITVSDGPKVSGRISLAATISGSKVNDYLTSITETKTEEGTGTFVYDLSKADLEESGGDRSANWNDAGFGGSANWESVHVTSYNYICDNVKNRIVTDKETTTRTFSSSSSGLQITGVGLSIRADGSYTIVIGPSTSSDATTTTKTEHSGYCFNTPPDSYSSSSPIPFAQYFIPYVGGGGDKLTGKIDTAEPDHVKGTYHGTDQYTLFSHDTTVVTLPLEYTITWDLILNK